MGKRGKYKKKFGKKGKKQKFFTKEDAFISRMASILMMPKGDVRSAFSQRSVSTLRINNLAGDSKDIEANLLMKGVFLEPVDWAPYTFVVPNKDKSDLGKMGEYEKGEYYIQNLSSILAVVILDPQEKDVILDSCAAPGSKTTYIASITNDKAKITANEEDPARMTKLQSVLDQFHVKNAVTKKGDARYIGKSYPDHFDKVLLDVPCSGEGLIYLPGEKPLRAWNVKKIKKMVSIQKEMILSSFDALKPGGTMVYATCTLEPDENEGAVTYLLENRDRARIESIPIVKDQSFDSCSDLIRPGITKWSGMKYHQESAKAIRVVPSSKTQGFFICKISKK